MADPDKPNPERRSDAAILCLCIGFGLIGLAWFLGIGGLLTAAFSGGAAGPMAGGLMALILLPLTGIAGAIFSAVGVVWLIVRVIADQREDHNRERYSRDIER